MKPFPLSLFPVHQMRIREMLERADDEREARPSFSEYLINKAREEANALRETIGGIS